MSAKSFPCKYKIVHDRQRERMVRSELRLPRLHYLHLYHFGLISSALVPVRRREVGHASQCGRMVRSELRLPLHHLHEQLFGLRPAALISVCRR